METDEKKVEIYIDTENCIGCGSCVELCPEKVYELNDEIANIVRGDACTACGACHVVCDYDALKIKDISQYSDFRKDIASLPENEEE